MESIGDNIQENFKNFLSERLGCFCYRQDRQSDIIQSLIDAGVTQKLLSLLKIP